MGKLKLGAIVALFLGPFLIITNFVETRQKQEIARDGIATIATPTAKISKRGRRGSRSYKLELQYPVQGGGTRTEQVSVSREVYDNAESQPLMQIKYSAKDPSRLIIVGERIENPAMYTVGAVLLALGAAGTWWFFVRQRTQAAPPPEARTVA